MTCFKCAARLATSSLCESFGSKARFVPAAGEVCPLPCNCLNDAKLWQQMFDVENSNRKKKQARWLLHQLGRLARHCGPFISLCHCRVESKSGIIRST